MVVGESKCFRTGSQPPKINENGELTVYSMRFCPYAERVRLLLNVKHIPYEIINIHLAEKPEWYLERNPLGKVPAIEEKGQKPLFESLICCEYLDEKYPGNKRILPTDPYEKARQKVLIEVISQKINTPFYGVLLKGGDEANEGLLKGADEVEKLLTNTFFAGDAMGYVDLMVLPWIYRLPSLKVLKGLQLTPERYPKLLAWAQAMTADPDVKATIYPRELLTAFLKGATEKNANYDEGL